jgi:hypothetical protein
MAQYRPHPKGQKTIRTLVDGIPALPHRIPTPKQAQNKKNGSIDKTIVFDKQAASVYGSTTQSGTDDQHAFSFFQHDPRWVWPLPNLSPG